MASTRLIYWSVTSALAGFLFGFDTIVISGADEPIQDLWKLTESMHGQAMSAALWGTVFGAMIAGFPADRLGRKPTLIGIGVLYFVSAIWSALAGDVLSFMIARFIGGVGVGISTVAAPMFISEIAPPHLRGRLAGMFQFNIVFGILVAYMSNALLEKFITADAWRWMLGAEAIPALLYSLMTFTIPESPRWLISRGRQEEGMKVLSEINPSAGEDQIRQLAGEIKNSTERSEQAISDGWSSRLRKPILLAFWIAAFNQLSGINAILYYAPRIFGYAGFARESALQQSIWIGVTNLIFTFVGLWLIDRVGRKTLLIAGSIGYIVSLSVVAWAFSVEQFNIVPFFVFAFIASHAFGQGAVIWVYISEIFPTRFRAFGQSLGSSTHWIFAALITMTFPIAAKNFDPSSIFLFFAGMMVLQLMWVLLFVPETKDVPLEEMEQKLGLVKT